MFVENDNKYCIVTDLIEEEYNGELETSKNLVDFDFSEPDSLSSTVLSTDLIFRFFAIGAEYQEGDWVADEDFSIKYYCCVDYLLFGAHAESTKNCATVDIFTCGVSDVAQKCEGETGVPRSALKFEVADKTDHGLVKQTLICSPK